MKKRVMIIAGEASGDLHGSGLVRELHNYDSELEIFGIGGDKMQAQGVELLYHISEMSVLGFGDVVKRFPFFRKVYSNIFNCIKERQPQLLILIDYPGLNLKLARAAKKLGVKVFYYIAPQVWAWGQKRIYKMATIVDKLAVIIPFEKKLFSEAGVDTDFVGHPILEVISTKIDKNEFLKTHQLDANKKIVGLLAGSRQTEVKRLLPEMIRTVNLIDEKHDQIQIVASRAPTVDKTMYETLMAGNSSIKLLDDNTYEIMKYSDLLIVASGTATLESALFETPLIIVYKLDPFSHFIGKRLVKINNIGLVNVIAEHEIVPEFVQNNFKSDKIFPIVEKLLFDENERQNIIMNLRKIKEKLGNSGASKKAAKLALKTMN